MTRGVSDKINAEPEFSKFIHDSLGKHFAGDWGNLDEHDKNANQIALEDDDRLLSAYISEQLRAKVMIITEADRSYTTVLFPWEY